jgi:single-strand DNA-binding protein
MILASLHGRLGQDPKPLTTRKGKPMTVGSLAVDVTPYGHDGDPVTEWINVTTFGAVADDLARHARGDVIGVMGKLTRRAWTDRDGVERQSWTLLAEQIVSARNVRSKAKATHADDGAPFDEPLPEST